MNGKHFAQYLVGVCHLAEGGISGVSRVAFVRVLESHAKAGDFAGSSDAVDYIGRGAVK